MRSQDRAFALMHCAVKINGDIIVWKNVFVLLDVKLAPWSEADENGQKTRTIHYTLNINYGFGQKCCPTIETQVRM